MSESRFDFLRELVKDVPDINVAEEQQAGEPESDLPLDLCQYSVSLSPPPANRPDDRPIATTSGSQPSRSALAHTSYVPPSSASSSSSNNGNSSGDFRNGNKRSHPSSSSSQQIQKQNSLDLSRLSNINTASHRPNYYTETSETASSVIQFSSSTHHASSEFSLLDYRPPKLSRLDSAPAILSSNNTTITAVTSQSGRNSNVSHHPTPVITIDFSKGIPSGPGLYSSPLVRPPIPALTPINTPGSSASASPAISPLKLQYPSDLISTPPAFVNIDVSKTPLVKIDYSKLDLSAPTSPTLPYTSKSTRRQLSSAITAGTGRKTKKPQTPVINIDLSNSFNLNVAPQMFTFCDASSTSTTTSANSNLSRALSSCTNTSSLDMDEDYDNI